MDYFDYSDFKSSDETIYKNITNRTRLIVKTI